MIQDCHAGRDTVHSAGCQNGDDVRVADGEGEVGVIDPNTEVALRLSARNADYWDLEEVLWKSRFDSKN